MRRLDLEDCSSDDNLPRITESKRSIELKREAEDPERAWNTPHEVPGFRSTEGSAVFALATVLGDFSFF